MEPTHLCVIYCRVSDYKQLKNGDGLKSQERSCRNFAALKGYSVLRVFSDEISGGVVSRSGFEEMLRFLQATHKEIGREIIVIIDDIKRFARDVESHYDLKHEVTVRGGKLESPQFRFENTPEGKFMETLFAAQAELERSQNARQVKNRMKARLEQGYWTFNVPPGYRYVKHPVHKKVVREDPARAPLVKEALKGISGIRFNSISEVCRFLTDAGFFGMPKPQDRRRNYKIIEAMLKHPLYTGHVAFPAWGVTMRKGHHPAFISVAEFDRIQRKLAEKSKPTLRADTKEAFPLRNFVLCASCGRRLTACWSRGKYATYPYYYCINRQCVLYAKMIRKADLEGDYERLLSSCESTDEVVNLAEALALLELDRQHNQRTTAKDLIAQRQKEIDAAIDRLADRMADAANQAVYRVLEGKIERLTNERCRLHETAELASTPSEEFRTQFDRVRGMLKSPYETWQMPELYWKRTITRMVFPPPLIYDRNEGFRTPEKSLPYRVLQILAEQKGTMVDPGSKSSNCTAQIIAGDGQEVNWAEFVAQIMEWTSMM